MFEKMRDMSSECGREWDQYVYVIVWVCDYVGAYSFTIFLFSIEGFGFKRLPLYMYTTRLWQNERSWYLRTHSFLISFFIFFLSFSQSRFFFLIPLLIFLSQCRTILLSLSFAFVYLGIFSHSFFLFFFILFFFFILVYQYTDVLPVPLYSE